MRISIATALTLLASTALAQTRQMPQPPYNRTFSSATQTRGFYFQTPSPIVITGLQVPDESNVGIQAVEVIQMSGPAPGFPNSATGTQVFFASGVPSSQVIACSLFFNAGDWIGILGVCGDATRMANSYGPPGTFQSDILGTPVTITRLRMQQNLISTGGNQPFTGEPTYEPARVFVAYTSAAGYASFSTYGQGCGAPIMTLGAIAGSRPVLGQNLDLEVTGIPASRTLGTLAIGSSQLMPPVSLTPLGMPGCEQHIGIDDFIVFPLVGATSPLSLPIPNQPGLAGLDFFVQSAVFAPGVNQLGVLVSNGGALTLDVQ